MFLRGILTSPFFKIIGIHTCSHLIILANIMLLSQAKNTPINARFVNLTFMVMSISINFIFHILSMEIPNFKQY